MPMYRISDETHNRLRRWAVPLSDSRNDVVSRVLDVAEGKATDLVAAAEAAALVMPEHPACQGQEVCSTPDTDRCCAGEVTRLQRAIAQIKGARSEVGVAL